MASTHQSRLPSPVAEATSPSPPPSGQTPAHISAFTLQKRDIHSSYSGAVISEAEVKVISWVFSHVFTWIDGP